MNIPQQDLKIILECVRRLVYGKDVLTDKDVEVVKIIDKLIGEDNE